MLEIFQVLPCHELQLPSHIQLMLNFWYHNVFKTSKRSLSPETINILMHIKINTPVVAELHPRPAGGILKKKNI